MSKYVIKVNGDAFNKIHLNSGDNVPLCTGSRAIAANWKATDDKPEEIYLCDRCNEMANPIPWETQQKIFQIHCEANLKMRMYNKNRS